MKYVGAGESGPEMNAVGGIARGYVLCAVIGGEGGRKQADGRWGFYKGGYGVGAEDLGRARFCGGGHREFAGGAS